MEIQKDVKGWGVDADIKIDPTYPMRKHVEGEHEGYNWERPPLQKVDIEVLRTNERINMPAVFGTSVPPSGLSGYIRRLAFKYGEGSFAHWIPLLVADRVNVVEGIIDDLKQGYVPNIFVERGIKAEWKYNKLGLLRKFVTGGAVAFVAFSFVYNRFKE
ncbi:hypothetical protein RCC89_20465 [Cytophagaceae bacterium ABcell3]|nr:hypothetical protein RCC89_20465 [Cytophagaceae bacterium ABcell3]